MHPAGPVASASTLDAAARLFANFVAHTRERCKCTTNNKSCYVEVRMKGLSKTKVKPILNNQQHSKQIQPPVGEQYKKIVDIPAVRSHFGSIAGLYDELDESSMTIRRIRGAVDLLLCRLENRQQRVNRTSSQCGREM